VPGANLEAQLAGLDGGDVATRATSDDDNIVLYNGEEEE
jgi:hypothetical protein